MPTKALPLKKSKISFAIFVAFIIMLALLAVLFFPRALMHTFVKPKTGTEQTAFKSLIDAAGPQKAYDEFKAVYQNDPFEIQHNAAHVMGRALYEKAGLDGFSICDATFAFGCYHAFLGLAIHEKGVGHLATGRGVPHTIRRQ